MKLKRWFAFSILLAVAAGCGGGEPGGKTGKTKAEYIQDLSNPTYLVRLAAVQYLSENAGPEDAAAVPILIKLLKAENETFRRFAAKSLGRIRDLLAVSSLTDAFGDENSYVRFEAVVALGSMLQDSRSREVMVRALEDPNSYVRHAAITNLGRTKDPAYAQLLIASLNDPNNFARSAAAEALGYLGNPLAVRYLQRSLRDQNSYVRSFSAASLGLLGNAAAVPDLKQALTDQVVWVQNHAARALARLGDKSGIPVLIENLSSPVSDKDNSAAQEAADFLREITGQDFGFSSKNSKKERDEAVARAKAWWETQ